MDEAQNVVEPVVEHGQARMSHGAEARQQVAQVAIGVDRLDVAALHHHVANRDIGELEHILQDGPLALGKVRGFSAALFVQGDLEVVAQRNRAAGQHGLETVPDRWPPRRHGGGTRRRLGFGGRRGAQTVGVVHVFSLPDGSSLSLWKTKCIRAIAVPASVGIGIIDPQARQYLGFKAFHLKSLGIGEMIIA